MADRLELLESALDCFPDGIALLDGANLLAFWNRAAEAITGYAGVNMLGRPMPETLEPLLHWSPPCGAPELESRPQSGRGFLARTRHKLGHDVSVMARILELHDGLGGRIGTEVVFHPAESIDALPQGDGEGSGVAASQADLKERLAIEFEEFLRGGQTFGVLWITVDPARDLRKTHGAAACGEMLEKVTGALARGLRPGEELGRWGDDEFLVLSHERTPEMLAEHAKTLAGQARTADFRWWGDRVQITVSIGAAQAERGGTLINLLERAKAAMLTSIQGGGNQIASAPEGQSYLPS
jgi:diguanylate cyclase (GGDEF)-like protein/PAS domain S-box-containing protein